MPNTFELNCLVSSDDSIHIFMIEIADTKTVSTLKKAIKAKNEQLFQHVDAKALVLLKVSLPIDESLDEKLSNFVGEIWTMIQKY
jgi:hypothetical protein